MKRYKPLFSGIRDNFLFNEAVIKVDVSWVKESLLKLKNKLINKDYGNLEIEEILNREFLPHFVKFENGFDSEYTNDFYGSVQIIKGSMYENGLIRIDYYSTFWEIFEDDTLYNEFIKVVSSIIYHERVHVYQLQKSHNKLKYVDTSSNYTYLSNIHEIQAHAQQAVFDLINMGYSVEEIKKKVKSKSEIKDFISSDAFWKYYDHFGQYELQNDDKYSKVWPIFLKYFYSTLEK